MNFLQFRWDSRAAIGVPVIVGVSIAAVGVNCTRQLPEATIDTDGKVGCVVGNFKFLNLNQSLGTVSGSQVQMNIVQTFDAIDSAQAIIDLSKIFLAPIQPLQTQEYLA